ncbi:TetR/AcrR family transcriptional regulator [Neobacillus rhizophilus]|uniref:TetR/AcrR family transcriptional regulator n=1 Tax=Neobacillus rhizophilus TaxID=2833579 RepID=A0A942U8J1_9BACI|nr:TetR/AcrR family transcriptional regulator [Neobacillus rhizophilus]MBS4214376.1 TetR/AcrR family transcriptional regulator [Neobacillus rhizophilus]MBU8915831.1 TetR/AcrR family transcriptional regulator [Bacillus sp. FJAT-29953]
MPPLNEQQLDQNREERREQIKRAALKVFAKRGIIGTKISMIAREAGISQGLTYRYYHSKDELFIDLVKDAMEETAEAFASLENMSGSPVEKIKDLTKKMLDTSNKHSFMLIQQVQTSDEVPNKAKEIVRQYPIPSFIEQLIPVFKKGQAMGEFCTGDPAKLLMLYFSVLSGLMLLPNKDEEGHQVLDVDILMKLIRE